MLKLRFTRGLVLAVAAALLSGDLASSLAAPAKGGSSSSTASQVELKRVPDGGIQPQVVVDPQGIVHLIYFKGDAGKGDLFYVKSSDAGQTFSRPIRVNSQSGSAIATGNIRGGQIAVGKEGRLHVAWNGSMQAEPKVGNSTPMLYARLDDSGAAFEPQRNIIQNNPGLDGGGTVAADLKGNVYVTWHAPESGTKGEDNRRVWVARSSDEGKTFTAEKAAFADPTGACGCCGMGAFADSQGRVFIMYRSASQVMNRDMYLLTSFNQGTKFTGKLVSEWKVGQCVMSTTSFHESPAGVLATWESEGQVYYGTVAAAGSSKKGARPVAAPGATGKRKYPVAASNADGQTILVWTEGMGWQRGGSVCWQVFDKTGKPIDGASGKNDGVPVWSLVAVFAKPEGGFTILY
jgi:hypothetical protein